MTNSPTYYLTSFFLSLTCLTWTLLFCYCSGFSGTLASSLVLLVTSILLSFCRRQTWDLGPCWKCLKAGFLLRVVVLLACCCCYCWCRNLSAVAGKLIQSLWEQEASNDVASWLSIVIFSCSSLCCYCLSHYYLFLLLILSPLQHYHYNYRYHYYYHYNFFLLLLILCYYNFSLSLSLVPVLRGQQSWGLRESSLAGCEWGGKRVSANVVCWEKKSGVCASWVSLLSVRRM